MIQLEVLATLQVILWSLKAFVTVFFIDSFLVKGFQGGLYLLSLLCLLVSFSLRLSFNLFELVLEEERLSLHSLFRVLALLLLLLSDVHRLLLLAVFLLLGLYEDHHLVPEGPKPAEAADKASPRPLLAVVAAAIRGALISGPGWQELVGRVVSVVVSSCLRATIEGGLATSGVALLP